jgi:nitroimidazol reductase NimA-like FMN-containing flavoprotein (pyridoxamine 5'-phosphate oxidase superfamily)
LKKLIYGKSNYIKVRAGLNVCHCSCHLVSNERSRTTKTGRFTRKSKKTITERDGQHDFDFEIGTWKTYLRRLQKPLTNSITWIEYEGTTVVRKIWNGRANLVELNVRRFMSDKIEQTNRTKLKRIPKRGNFDRETINEILDEAFVCHVGFAIENQPFVLPTAYARDGDKLLIHGSSASRMMRNLSNGIEVCITVTLIDGLVLARSAFHHSMNYRSVVVFGKAELVEDDAEKNEALRLFTEHIIPGRWDAVRLPTAKELKATTVLRLPIQEASAKIRTGNPVDDEADYDLNVWAGVIPLKMIAGQPENDSRLKDETVQPFHVSNYKR